MHVGQDHEERERHAIPWYRRKEERPQAAERAWGQQTERWVQQEIRKGTAAGRYLAARRARALAALGMTLEQALSRVTFEGKGDR